MSPFDFENWQADLTRKFPAIGEWLHKLGPMSGELLADWCDVLENVSAADAMAANKRLLVGDDDGPGKFPSDWQVLPAKIRSMAWKLSQSRPQRSTRDQLPERDPGSPGDLGIGRMFCRLMELKERGMPAAEAKAQALREFPVGSSPYREPRYSCLTCRDTGRVLVSSPSAIKAVLLGTFAHCHHREAAARCFCQAGTKLERPGEWQTFDPEWDFGITDPLWGEGETARFAAWVECQREQFNRDRLKQFEWKPPQQPLYANSTEEF